MKLLLLGASSYVGARLYIDLDKQYSIVGTYHTNQLFPALTHLSITDQREVEHLITTVQPEIIIHTANNASSKWCAEHPDEAMAVNQTATQYIVDAANMTGARVVYISSYAALEPTNLYAQSKLASEIIVQQTRAGYLIVRPSLIVGLSPNTTNDRPFNRLLKNLSGEPAIYDSGWRFQPTYLGHLSEVIDSAIKKSIWNTVIAVAVPELTSRYALARDILMPFDVPVAESEKKDASPIAQTDLSFLSQLGLPEYSYPEMISRIVREIRDSSNTLYHRAPRLG